MGALYHSAAAHSLTSRRRASYRPPRRAVTDVAWDAREVSEEREDNRSPRQRLLGSLVAFVTAVSVSLSAVPAEASFPRTALPPPAQELLEAWSIVRSEFYDPSRLSRWDAQLPTALEAASASPEAATAETQRLLASLGDPYTKLMPSSEFRRFRAANDGVLTGVGLLLTSEPATGKLLVVRPLPDSPAAAAGLQPGDELLGVGTHVLPKGAPPGEAGDLLRGTSGTSVLLRFRRTDSVPGTPSRPPFSVVKTLRLRRAAIPLPSASLALLFPENVGLLRLASFTETAGEEVEAALAAASAAGAKALILDLRGNPGGLVRAALEVSRPFLSAGDEIVSTTSRGGAAAKVSVAPGGPAPFSTPLAVLIDGGSASASEIVAGALRDNGRAVLLGSQSYGKGKIQSVYPLSSGGALFATVAVYHTPSGASIDKVGITPDWPCESFGATGPLPPGAGPPGRDACVVAAEKALGV